MADQAINIKPRMELSLSTKGKIFGVVNSRSKNFVVENSHPKNGIAIQTKPQLGQVGALTNRTYKVTIRRGMPMGLLLALTYPTDITVIQNHD